MGSTTKTGNGITKLTNCRLLRGDELVWDDLWVSSTTGRIVQSQAAFYDDLIVPNDVIDLGGRIVSPGFIDSQLNGAFGFNFSTVLDDMSLYDQSIRDLNKKLVQTGVTSYVPTVTSQTSALYQRVLPHLASSSASSSRDASSGAESLGAHVEGPFLNPLRNGVHNVAVLRRATSLADLESVYGAANLTPSTIKMITLAPELSPETTKTLIPALRSRDIIVSIGHSNATYEEASAAVSAGATMITHLFNAMAPLHHRNPGIFGVLGGLPSHSCPPPYFGIIADGIHLHPTTTKIAFNAHPDGLVLVTDAMHMAGLPDGRYPWRNGTDDNWILKRGAVLVLEGRETTIAGSSTLLINCVNNFVKWTGAGVPRALGAVTATPAAMLGLSGKKGTLEPGADADLVVLSDGDEENGTTDLAVDEVWKFGVRVFQKRKKA
ncbi:carbohydrate esterase [Echria macrotheca]|uniref:N-acetylglucosamine-6-phosphate deacetylase n=1 Tax=Echria macrotheca TaxID=438768 RepID=A0AAJ0BCB8_9PEZI|nr:carbohydrate esterase [Echria macrotheca]